MTERFFNNAGPVDCTRHYCRYCGALIIVRAMACGPRSGPYGKQLIL